MVYFGARYYDPDTARFITQDSYLGESGTPPSLHRYLYAYSNPTVYVDLYGYEAQAYAQPTVYSETDMFGPSPVRDTGYQIVDDLWAGADAIVNMGKYVINGASAIASSPTIAYAAATDQTVQQADEELTGYMASAGPLALSGSSLFRVGPKFGYAARVARAEAKAVAKTTKKISKEISTVVKNEVKDTVNNLAIKTLEKTGGIKYAAPLNANGKKIKNVKKKGVNNLQVDPKGTLDSQAKTYDGLQHHEIPTKAAIEEAYQQKTGVELSPKEKRAMQKENTAIAIKNSVHKKQLTTGSSNKKLFKEDAQNLTKAANRDTRHLIKTLKEEGHSKKELKTVVQEIRKTNKKRGI